MIEYKYNSGGSIDRLIDDKALGLVWTTLSTEETQVIIESGQKVSPYIKPAETLGDIRAERDLLLAKNVDIYNPLRWAELTTQQKDSVKKYRQALLDITKQAPSKVIWPNPPSI